MKNKRRKNGAAGKNRTECHWKLEKRSRDVNAIRLYIKMGIHVARGRREEIATERDDNRNILTENEMV